MATVDGSKSIDDLHLSIEFLLLRGIFLGSHYQVLIDEIFKPGQRPQPVLPAEFVEAGNASFSVPNDVERCDIDLVACFVDLQILEELRMVQERQSSQPLPSHGHRQVGQSLVVHGRRSFLSERLDDWNHPLDVIRFMELSILDQVGHHRMQAIDGDEFLWEVERGAEVVRASVDMIGVRERVRVRTKEEMPAIPDLVTHAEDARASGKSRVFEIGIREVAGVASCGP